jgi:trk system potassium uptake protein TrkA
VIVAPTAMDQLKTGDIMVIIGSNENVEEFEMMVNENIS